MRLQVNSFILGRKTNSLFEIGMAVVRMSIGTDKLRSQNEPKGLDCHGKQWQRQPLRRMHVLHSKTAELKTPYTVCSSAWCFRFSLVLSLSPQVLGGKIQNPELHKHVLLSFVLPAVTLVSLCGGSRTHIIPNNRRRTDAQRLQHTIQNYSGNASEPPVCIRELFLSDGSVLKVDCGDDFSLLKLSHT